MKVFLSAALLICKCGISLYEKTHSKPCKALVENIEMGLFIFHYHNASLHGQLFWPQATDYMMKAISIRMACSFARTKQSYGITMHTSKVRVTSLTVGDNGKIGERCLFPSGSCIVNALTIRKVNYS